MEYQQFKAEWLGKRVDYDKIYGYQCVDLPLEYYYEVDHLASGIWGNAIDYANNPTPTFLKNFQKVSEPYEPGDTLVFYGLPGNPYGHMGLFDHQDDSGVWPLEQNAMGTGDGLGKSAIGVYRSIPFSRLAAAWRFTGTPVTPRPVTLQTVFLPSSAGPWHLYNVGSGLNPNNRADVKAILRPDMFPPGLTYNVEAWVGDYAVVIQTQDFGRGVVWVKGTAAQLS